MRLIILLLFFISTSTFAQNYTPINSDLRCDLNGGVVAIKLPSKNNTGSVWHTDIDETEGIELTNVNFTQLNCDDCYSFTAELIDINFKGLLTNNILTYEAYTQGHPEEKVTHSNIKCVKN